MRRRPRPGSADGSPVTADEVSELLSAPMILQPGVPSRRFRCLVCGMLIGGRECRTITAIDWAGTGCDCCSLPAVAYLICADHPVAGGPNYAQLALDAWNTAHAAKPA